MSFHLQMKILSLKDLLFCLSVLWAGHPQTTAAYSYIHFLREEPSPAKVSFSSDFQLEQNGAC